MHILHVKVSESETPDFVIKFTVCESDPVQLTWFLYSMQACMQQTIYPFYLLPQFEGNLRKTWPLPTWSLSSPSAVLGDAPLLAHNFSASIINVCVACMHMHSRLEKLIISYFHFIESWYIHFIRNFLYPSIHLYAFSDGIRVSGKRKRFTEKSWRTYNMDDKFLTHCPNLHIE